MPGFVGNRLQHALWREAIALVAEGVCDAKTVDDVVKSSFGARLAVLGPLGERRPRRSRSDARDSQLRLAGARPLDRALASSRQADRPRAVSASRAAADFVTGQKTTRPRCASDLTGISRRASKRLPRKKDEIVAKATTSNKVIVTCAVTGGIHTPTMSDALAYTPDDIATQSIAAAEAGGAAAAHKFPARRRRNVRVGLRTCSISGAASSRPRTRIRSARCAASLKSSATRSRPPSKREKCLRSRAATTSGSD